MGLMRKMGSLEQTQKNQQLMGAPLRIVLRPAGTDSYIARHLRAISGIVEASDRFLGLSYDERTGLCQIDLPPHYCTVRAQALALKLGGLSDNKGVPIVDAEVAPQTGARSRASVTPPPRPEN